MDVLGAALSIVAVRDLAIKIQKDLRRFKDGSGWQPQLRLELNRANTLLFQVRDILEQDIFDQLSQDQFGVLVSALYTQLEFLFRTLEAFNTSKSKDYIRRIFREGKIRQTCKEIQETLTVIELNVQITLAQAETNLAPVKAHVSSALDFAGDKNLAQEVVDWLGPYDPSGRQSENLSKRIPGTGSWLLKDKKFQEWIEHPGSTMWLCGLAGMGKTYLCSIIIDYLARHFPGPGNALGYIFLNLNDRESMKPLNIVTTLLKQIIPQSFHLQAVLTQRYQLSKQQGTRPQFDEWLSILVSELSHFERAWIVLDAMDEYKDGIESFLTSFEPLIHSTHANIFVTSRPIPQSESLLPNSIRIEGQATNDDIYSYISHRLSGPEAGRAVKNMMKDPQPRSWITEKLIQGSNRMFIVAELLLDEVLNSVTEKQVRSRLESYGNLPIQLESVYDKVMESLFQQAPADVHLALETLTWLCFSCRPLSAKEVQDGLALQFGDSDINKTLIPSLNSLVTVCFNLVVVTHFNGQVLSLVHLSAKDYLSENLDRWIRKYQVLHLGNPHSFLARKCVAYLSLNIFDGQSPQGFEDLKDKPHRYPMLGYAANFWGVHARKTDSEDLSHDATSFFASESQVMTAGLMMAKHEKFASHYEYAYKGVRPLHIAAIFDLENLVTKLKSNGNDLNATTQGKWTALHWAARNGSEKVVSLLASFGALTDIPTNIHCWTPLHLAAKENHPRIVASLLDAGADVNARDVQKRTPLYLACSSCCPEVVSVLLSHARKADASISNAQGATPLHCAARKGSVSIVNLLIGHSDLRITDDLGLTPLDEANRKGHQAVVEILLRSIPQEHDINLSTLSLTPVTLLSSSAGDLRWNTYEIDQGRTSLIQEGKQCLCQVLRKKDSTESSQETIVFRKIFNLTSDVHGYVRYFSSELQILNRLRHPNIVSFLDFDEDLDQNFLILYLEYCDKGDLTQLHGLPPAFSEDSSCGEGDGSSSGEDDEEFGFYQAAQLPMSQTTPLNGADTWSLIYQLSSALAYLHYGLSIKKDDAGYTASFERSWEHVLHRDIKPANVVMQSSEDGKHVAKMCDLGIAAEPGRRGANQTQYIGSSGFHPPEVQSGNLWNRKVHNMRAATIERSFKLKDGDTESICQFIKNCRSRDPKKRKSSIHIMQEAYSHLQQNGGLGNLPKVIAKQGEAVHSLLDAHTGGYVLQSFKLIAEILDDVMPYDYPRAKENRKSTIKRLNSLLTDESRHRLLSHTYEYSAHLYVVLSRPSDLQTLLSSGIDPNVYWRHSRLTPLHVASQEGKQEMVDILLDFGARKSVKDLHNQLPVDYARAAGHTEIANRLEALS